MASFAVDDDLTAVPLIGQEFATDALLQVQYDWAGGIYEMDGISFCLPVSGRRFTMSSQKDVGITQAGKLFVVDGRQSHLPKALHFPAVVHDIAKAVELVPGCQFLFGFAYGTCYTETKT